MSDRTYATLVGIVQSFGQDSPVRERDVKGQTVREFTVKSTKVDEKTGKQALVRISLWPEWDSVDIQEGAAVIAEGTISVTPKQQGDGDWVNMNPKTIVVLAPVNKKARTVVNASDNDTSF